MTEVDVFLEERAHTRDFCISSAFYFSVAGTQEDAMCETNIESIQTNNPNQTVPRSTQLAHLDRVPLHPLD